MREIPPPDPGWPPDVLVLIEEINELLFEPDLLIEEVKRQCGIRNNNIASRFRHFVGHAPKSYVLQHRMALAQRLLRYEELTVTQVSFAVGYASPNGFAMTFKRWVGAPPIAFRQDVNRQEKRDL